MSNIPELIDHFHNLTPLQGLFLICGFALAVVWKALDLVAKSQGKNHRRGPHE
jgi:hypothetical protein